MMSDESFNYLELARQAVRAEAARRHRCEAITASLDLTALRKGATRVEREVARVLSIVLSHADTGRSTANILLIPIMMSDQIERQDAAYVLEVRRELERLGFVVSDPDPGYTIQEASYCDYWRVSLHLSWAEDTHIMKPAEKAQALYLEYVEAQRRVREDEQRAKAERDSANKRIGESRALTDYSTLIGLINQVAASGHLSHEFRLADDLNVPDGYVLFYEEKLIALLKEGGFRAAIQYVPSGIPSEGPFPKNMLIVTWSLPDDVIEQ